MNKNQLIFTVKSIMEGQTPTQDGLKFNHPQDIEYFISMAHEKAVIDFYTNPLFADMYDKDYFTKTYTESVKKDSYNNLYIDLPASPIALPNGQGIKSLMPSGSYVNIIRVTEAEWVELQHLEAFCCSPWPFCFIDFYDKKIILQANRAEYNVLDTLRLKIVPKLTSLSGTDELNEPGGDYNLTAMVLQLTGLRPTDNTNDDGR